MTNAITAPITRIPGQESTREDNLIARNMLVPVFPSTSLSVMPPPNNNNTPQSVPRPMSRHRTTRKNSSGSTAVSATTVSIDCAIPSHLPSGAPNIQHSAVVAKTASVTTRCQVKTNGALRTSSSRVASGRKTHQSTRTISGSNTITAGTPKRSHSPKLIPSFCAAIPFGGLPTKVPMPPTLAE